MRKNTECNAFEYLVARILSPEIRFNNMNDKVRYLHNLNNRPKQLITSYENTFRKEMALYPEFSRIKTVFLTGKHCQIPEICALNQQEDPLEAKADVYALLQDNSWIGISVKQTSRATKSNYSVQSRFSQSQNLYLTEVKKQFLQSHGFTTLVKSERPRINKLFYQDNSYWSELKKIIQEHNDHIKTFLYKKLYASLRYPLFEFDSKKMTKLTNEPAEIVFEEYRPYYYTKKGVRRNAAKLFYRLLINNKEYRVEIRWKGDIFKSSPQFHIHEMN
jgi:hypothetical protein